MKSYNKISITGILVPVLLTIAVLFPKSGFAQGEQEKPKVQQAQQNFTEQELKQFAEASTRLMDIQRKGEEKMLKILEEEKLSVNKFNEMAQAHQQEKLDEVEATAEEKVAFDKAAKRMMEMQPELQKDVESAIQKDGMSLDKYEQIMMAYRQDPALQEKLNKMMEQQ